MPQGLSAGPQRPTRPGPGGRPAQRRLAASLSTGKRASTKLPAQRGHVSQPGTAPLELSSTANGWWQQNQDRRAASATTNAPVASSASGPARVGQMRDGGRGARRSQRPAAGRVAAGVEGQRGGEQCGGDDGPQQQHGLLPAQPRAQAARLRAGYARRGCRRARRGRWTAGRPRRTRVFSRAGIPSPAASRLKMVSMEACRGQNRPGRPQWSPGPAALVR